MSDFGAYRDKVALLGKQAAQAEDAKDYKGAFEYYTKALDIFAHMIKCKLTVYSKEVINEGTYSKSCDRVS